MILENLPHGGSELLLATPSPTGLAGQYPVMVFILFQSFDCDHIEMVG